MKKRILSLIVSLSICATAALSLPSCGDRNSDSSSSSASASESSASTSAGPDADSTSQNSTSTSSSEIDSSGNVKVVWTSTADAEGDIDLFTATFKVTDSAPAGLNEITVGGDVIIADDTFQNLDVAVVAGGIDVGGSNATAEAPSGAAIVVETVGANTGDEVSVVVKLVNVDICTTIGFNVLFDAEALEFVEIVPSSVLDSCGQLVYNVF